MLKRLLAVALIGGIIGGIISRWIDRPRITSVSEKQSTAPVDIRAKSLSIVDEQGNVRISLRAGYLPNTSAITMVDDDKQVRVILGIHDGTPELDFTDSVPGNTRVKLTATKNGPVRLGMQDSQEGHGIILATSVDNKTALVFHSHNADHRVVLGLNAKEEGHLTIYGSDGKVLRTIP